MPAAAAAAMASPRESVRREAAAAPAKAGGALLTRRTRASMSTRHSTGGEAPPPSLLTRSTRAAAAAAQLPQPLRAPTPLEPLAAEPVPKRRRMEAEASDLQGPSKGGAKNKAVPVDDDSGESRWVMAARIRWACYREERGGGK